MTELLVAAIALAAGLAGGWLARAALAGRDRSAADARAHALEEQLAARAREIETLRPEPERRAAAEARAARVPELAAELERRSAELSDLKAKLAGLEAAVTEERKSATEKQAILSKAETVLADAFKSLSADALKSNNQAFIDLAKATLEKFQEGARGDLEARHKAVDELVRPIRESLEKVDGKIGEIEKVRLSSYSALNEQLKGLVDTHLPMLRNETANLVKALRQPIVRGRWGEIQLKRVVEMAGMLDHCDFLEQESRTTETGRLRPDMIVRLPGGKSIVVDAKAPISAYLDATESEDETVQRVKLADHARHVREHMTQLGRKAYWEQFDPAPEFVILFLPGEMFFSSALQQDPGLIEFGANERVIPATPTTLISLLKAVSYGWRQEALAQNAQEVAALGRTLYERIRTLGEHWNRVGDRLDGALDAYNKASASMDTRVITGARRFAELKAAPEGLEIEPLRQVERAARRLQAPEFAQLPIPGAGDER
jgi:DNA recombination protein RmuC